MQAGDTIAAISTSAQRSARIIVRLSGPASFSIAAQLTNRQLTSPGVARATITFKGLAFPALLYRFVGPRSYSGEDLIEFHIPGNPWLADQLMRQLLTFGARLADPGEFTARAYFNGRLDLTEAEGVAAAVSAASQRESEAARGLLSGELTRRLEPILNQLAETLALVEVGIDFVEEDVSFLERDACERQVDDVDRQLAELMDGSVRFERLAHEPTIALAGRPNGGKSTLLNALAGVDRSIVSNVEGTTRDVIWAHVDLPRGRVRMTDSAGLEDAPSSTGREHVSAAPAIGSNPIDEYMQSHALRAVAEADVYVLVQALDDPRPAPLTHRAPDLIARTKSDVMLEKVSSDACDCIAAAAISNFHISAHTGAGMNAFRAALDQVAFGADDDEHDQAASRLALNARHLDCLREARHALAEARAAARAPELLAADLRAALDHLGAISGRVTPDDLLGRIFSAFCIGK